MKKSLIFWFAAVTCAALFLVGCEQEAETKTDTVTKYVAGDITGLNKLLDEGVSPIRYVSDLEIGTATVFIPAGVTVNVDGGVTLGATGKFIVVGNLNLGTGENITVTGAGLVVGSDTVLAKVTGGAAVTGPVAGTVAEATAAFTTESVVLVTGAVSGAALDSTAVPSAKTLYVANTLTLAAAPAPGGSVIPLGTVSVTAATLDISTIVDDTAGNGKLTLTNATLTNSAAAAVTLPATVTVKGVAVGSAELTISGVTTVLTVGSITNGGGSLKLATASSIIKQAGDDDATFTFGAANQVLVKPALADSTLTLGGATTLVGALSLGDTAKVELGASATLITAASDAITVGDSGATFTPTGAGVTFPAGTEFDGATKTVTLGSAGITIGGSTTTFEVNKSGVLKGKIVLDNTTDSVTLDKAVITGAASAAVTFTKSGAVVGLAAGTSLALEDEGAITTAGGGTVTAGATTFSGVGTWTASFTGTAGAATVDITSAATGATIAFNANGGSATAGALTASGTNPTITQAAGSGNTLAIAADTTIALGGDGAAVGSIVLTGDNSNPGKLTFTAYGSDDVGTSLVTTGNSTATNKVTGLTKVADKGVGVAIVGYLDNSAAASATKVFKLGASNETNSIVGGGDGNNATISGQTYTAGTFNNT